MTTWLGWLNELLLDDTPSAEPGALTVWLSVGSEIEPAGADLAVEAGTAERACAMLRMLARAGHVGRVRLAVAPELDAQARRRLRRLARRLRAVALSVEWIGSS